MKTCSSCLCFRLPVFALFFFTLLAFELPAAGNPQESKSELVKIEYDQQKNTTQVSLNPFVIASRKFEELRLGAVAVYPGKVKVRPREIVLQFFSLSPTEMNKYESARKLTVVADGQRLTLGEAQHAKDFHNELFIESMMVSVPTDVFLRICWSKEVTMKLGSTEVELSPENIAILRAAASHMTDE